MNEFDQRIAELQSWMRRDGLKAYLIPATDPHLSEEACSRYTYPRFYFCSFKIRLHDIFVRSNIELLIII